MIDARNQRIVMDGNGSYLGMSKGCFVLRDRKGNEEKYPLFENQIKEVVLQSGNSVSTGALASLGFWDVDVMVMTARGKPVAVMKSLDDDSHVKTRLCQYEAYNGEKGLEIAKQLVIGKIKGQNILLEKYGLRLHDINTLEKKIDSLGSSDRDSFLKKLTGVEGKFTEHYFRQVFQLIPEKLRPEKRKKFKAYDGVNNIFNLAYEVLQWKVHRAIIKAKLEPYLGFLHSVQYGKPSLVCDLEELYRYLVDDFVVDYVQGLKPSDFTTKTVEASKNRKGKREYLNAVKTRVMMRELNDYFDSKIELPLIRHGKRQRIETLINEEALLLAKYIRKEIAEWTPRIPY
ncbi:CRISPR-associated endonuclease Cas1 [Thermoproteota archaeon]